MRFLREPLLHFLVAGVLLFVAYHWMNRGSDKVVADASRTVQISAAEVEWLAQTWARQWQRPPSEEELKGLVAGYLKEELLAREARALGLDQNDTIVRRRLAQKMEFMVQDTVHLAEPSEDELRRFYVTQRERFQTPARVSFAQVYFNRDRRGARTEADADAALQELSEAGATVSATGLGDRFLAGYEFVDADEPQVASLLGSDPAHQVFALTPGSWHGPIVSDYGLHLVRVSDREPAQPREFDTVRGEVLALWNRQQEDKARERYFAELFQKYDVVVDASVSPLLGPLSVVQREESAP